MWTKRLEKGRFRPAFFSDQRLSSMSIEAAELALIVDGIELAGCCGARWMQGSSPGWVIVVGGTFREHRPKGDRPACLRVVRGPRRLATTPGM